MSVFLSHAGEQKWIFVDHVYEALREEGVVVFMDESSLRCGDTAWPTILAALHGASVGVSRSAGVGCQSKSRFSLPIALSPAWDPHAVVLVLSSDFVRKRYPMEELALLLKRKRQEQGFRLLPVLYGITYEQCRSLPEGYHSEDWVLKGDKPGENILQQWAAAVKELLDITAVRQDQVLFTAAIVEVSHALAILVAQGNVQREPLLLTALFCMAEMEPEFYLLRSTVEWAAVSPWPSATRCWTSSRLWETSRSTMCRAACWRCPCNCGAPRVRWWAARARCSELSKAWTGTGLLSSGAARGRARAALPWRPPAGCGTVQSAWAAASPLTVWVRRARHPWQTRLCGLPVASISDALSASRVDGVTCNALSTNCLVT